MTLTSKFAREGVQSSRLCKVLKVGGEGCLPVTERALGESIDSEQTEESCGGLRLTNDIVAAA